MESWREKTEKKNCLPTLLLDLVLFEYGLINNIFVNSQRYVIQTIFTKSQHPIEYLAILTVVYNFFHVHIEQLSTLSIKDLRHGQKYIFRLY